MAHLSRAQVIARAENTYPRSGYIFDWVWWGANPQVMCGINSAGYGSTTVTNKPYVATECSGWISWCWGLTTRINTTNFKDNYSNNSIARQGNFDSYEEQFPGIVPGDALWREGHIALYMGNNTIWHASQSNWKATTSGHGMSVTTGGKGNYQLCLKFNSEYSGEYDPEDPDSNPDEDNFWDGETISPIEPPDLGDPEILAIIYKDNYTKKLPNMKSYRRF